MEIGKNKVVSVSYKLTVDGQVWEEAGTDDPLVYLSGIGTMIPGFENQLNNISFCSL